MPTIASVPSGEGVYAAMRRLVANTVGDPTIAYLSVALLGHLMIAGVVLVIGHRIEALDVGIVAVDISALGQLVVRINIDTIRMIKRARRPGR